MYGLVKLAVDQQKKNNLKVYNYLKENYPADCLQWAKKVDWILKPTVSLSKIKMARRPGGAREMDKVKGIAGAIKDGKKMDPVVLVELPDGSIKIADGYHRTLGTEHAGKKTINAWIAKVSESKGPWDKEMHEKKLNVGKKSSLGLVGLNKEASLLGLVGLGAAFHVAPNLIMKIVKSSKKGQKALGGLFHAGVEMGKSGQKLHPNFQSALEYGMGPESLVDFHLGRKFGEKLKDMSDAERQSYLNLYKHTSNTGDGLLNVPLVGSAQRYLQGDDNDKVKNLVMIMGIPEDKKTGWKNYAGNLAALGGAAAINPHLLIQPLLSGVRKRIAQSKLGGKILEKGFESGRKGENLSKIKELLIDYGISPATLDTYRIGKTMNEKLPKPIGDVVADKIDWNKLHKNN